MNLNVILPLLVPALFMQVLITATIIRHCIHNTVLTRRAKAWSVAAIAVFNIPAAAAYLFLSRPRDASAQDDSIDTEVDGNIRQGTFILLTVAFEVFSLRVLVIGETPSQDPRVGWLLAICFVTFILQGLFDWKRKPAVFLILPLIQIVLIMTVCTLDDGQGSQFLVLAVMAGIINACPLQLARLHSLLAFLAYLSVSIVKMVIAYPPRSADNIISTVYVNMLVFVMVYMAFYMLKKQLIANKRLKEQTLKLEEMAALRERSRITGEIHDTVGHTLVSAVIAIEAGEKLLLQNPEAAREKLVMAREQVRQGLLDIRQAVKTIQAGGEKAFLPALHELTVDIRRRTALEITVITDIRTTLLPIQQNVLLNALKECATNSLKHGHATHADLLLTEYKGTVTFTFTDDGSGTNDITYGFGLTNMSKQVKSIGGTLFAGGKKEEGFTVSITIPTGSIAGGV